jgi:predicted aconitase with swiveling domain
MPLRREWNLPIFDGRVRPPLMVNHYPGGRSCQGGVPSERGKLLDGSEHQGRLLTRRDGRGRSSASTVGFQPTKNDRAKFRFLLNQHRIMRRMLLTDGSNLHDINRLRPKDC